VVLEMKVVLSQLMETAGVCATALDTTARRQVMIMLLLISSENEFNPAFAGLNYC